MSRLRVRRTGRVLRALAVAGVVAATAIGTMARPGPSEASDASTTLFGEGGSFSEPIINKLQADANPVIAPLVPAYFNANVDQGNDDFASGAADYSVSEVPLTTAQAAAATSKGRSFAYVPFAANAIAIGAVILCSADTTLKPGTLCPNLELTVPEMTKVFSSDAVTWTDSTFAQAQGGSPIAPIDASKAVNALHEVTPTALNLGLATLFENNTLGKTVWQSYLTLNKLDKNAGPSELWPTGGGVTGGDQAVADLLVPVNEINLIPQQNPTLWGQGTVAPLPADWLGAPRNIPTVKIDNAAGAFVAPTVDAMTAAEQHVTMDPNTNLVTFGFSTTDKTAYPIPSMSYLVVPTSGLAPAKATALAAFIRFVLGTQGQADVAALGAAPVTPDMVKAGLHVADEVAAEATAAPSANTSSTTTTTSTPVAASTSASIGALTSDTGPTLALTGGSPWPLAAAGLVLAVAGVLGRRLARGRGGRPQAWGLVTPAPIPSATASTPRNGRRGGER